MLLSSSSFSPALRGEQVSMSLYSVPFPTSPTFSTTSLMEEGPQGSCNSKISGFVADGNSHQCSRSWRDEIISCSTISTNTAGNQPPDYDSSMTAHVHSHCSMVDSE
ncbi:hypothetical protein ACOME3_009364 [Neoechinorhynchus agilis]